MERLEFDRLIELCDRHPVAMSWLASALEQYTNLVRGGVDPLDIVDHEETRDPDIAYSVVEQMYIDEIYYSVENLTEVLLGAPDA